MKWPQDQIDIMEDAFRQFLDSFSKDGNYIEELKKAYHFQPDLLMQRVAYQVTYDLQCDDSHPAYSDRAWKDGEIRPARIRRVKHNPNFVLYPPGCDDKHNQTMLKYVAKRVGLVG